MYRVIVLTTALGLTLLRESEAQILSDASGTYLVTGQVLEVHTGRPVSAAIVELRGGGISAPPQHADPDGHFVFRNVPSGNYRLAASAPGYFQPERSDTAPGGEPLGVTGRSTAPIHVRLVRASVIRGRILDEMGEPLSGITVRAFSLSERASSAAGVSDDLGQYEIGGLRPGAYAVATSLRREGSPPSDDEARQSLLDSVLQSNGVHPAASASVPSPRPLPPRSPIQRPAGADAVSSPLVLVRPGMVFGAGAVPQPLHLGTSADRSDVDISVPLVPARSVRGVVSGAPPEASVTIRLLPMVESADLPPMELARSPASGTGVFRLSMVPEGRYRLVATAWMQADTTSVGYVDELLLDTAVDDFENLVLVLRAGPSVTGDVRLGNEAVSRVDVKKLEFTFEPLELSWLAGIGPRPSAPVNQAGEFDSGPLLPAWYHVRSRLPSGLTLSWSQVPGGPTSSCPFRLARDGTRLSIEVQAAATLSGVVATGTGLPASVLVIPADQAVGQSCPSVREAVTGEGGRFSVTDLAPGDYHVVATSAGALGLTRDPGELVERLPAEARRVSLRPGETRALSLQKGQLR